MKSNQPMRRVVRAGRAAVEYELVRTERKSMELRVSQDAVRVFAPRGAAPSVVDAFVRERVDWLADAQRRLSDGRKAREDAMTSGARVMLEGRALTLLVARADAREVFVEGETLCVRAPNPAPEAVREAVRGFMIERARETLARRVNHFAPLVGRAPGRVTLREQRTRWGSCSNKRNLNFNWKLIMAPPGALDYVVVHELCHLYELNHSERFWALVERFCPDYREWKQWLKQNGACLDI